MNAPHVGKKQEPDFANFYTRAGSYRFEVRQPPDISDVEFHRLYTQLASVESDGPHDTKEWKLFDIYLSARRIGPRNPHNLSKLLEQWRVDKVSVPDEYLRFFLISG